MVKHETIQATATAHLRARADTLFSFKGNSFSMGRKANSGTAGTSLPSTAGEFTERAMVETGTSTRRLLETI